MTGVQTCALPIWASNITWIDIMAKAGAPNELYIWDFTIARIPLLVVSILYMTFVGYKLMPDIDNNTFVDGGHTGRKSAKLSPIKEKIAIIIIVVTILAMLFESVIGIPMYIVACIGAVLLVLSGILNEKEALDSIHQPTIFLLDRKSTRLNSSHPSSSRMPSSA